MDIINKVFPQLNGDHANLLNKYYDNLIKFIEITVLQDNDKYKSDFQKKLRINNYYDGKNLLLLLLPFINPNQNLNNLKNLNQIFTDKNININDFKNNIAPKYIYSNIQFNSIDINNFKELEFSEEYLRQNFYLLLDTIKLCYNKLYVNWYEIVPVNKSNIFKTDLFLNTVNFIRSRNMTDLNLINFDLNNFKNYFKHLTMDDIYDTITNEFYFNVKKVKWLIYDIADTQEIKLYPLIIIMYNLLDSNSNLLIKDIPTIDDLSSFSKNWLLLVNLVKTNDNWISKIRGNNINIPTNELKKILYSIMVFFNNYYPDKKTAIKNNEYQPFLNETEEDDDFEIKKLQSDKDLFAKLIESAETVNVVHIFNFIKYSLKLFKNTFYYYEIFNNDHTLKYYNYTGITYKNLYNFSKSLCHYTQNKNFLMYPRFWRSLDNDQKTIILNRFNNPANRSWFNISQNLRTAYDEIMNINQVFLNNKHDDIYNTFINAKLAEYIINSLITRGILSELKPEILLTDLTIVDYNNRKKKIPSMIQTFNDTQIKQFSYYYLNNLSYDNFDLVKDNVKTYFLDYLKSNDSRGWYLAEALNFVNQLNFFHRFNHNRVIYVTGGTGIGKSTNVPILFMYALKSILYNPFGQVVCTQPRINATEGNAKTVSTTLGVPLDNRNYFIQYKHEKSKHIAKTKNPENLVLKFVTDKTLLNEILQNPVIKKTFNKNNKINYSTDNIYDIIMVDEAHEHNKNMDIILTIMKYITAYNNSTKLIIVSATMDDDEPIYRRFYRYINDNRAYPLNYFIKENNLDRANIDRRLNIDTAAKFKINEYYSDNANIDSEINKIIEFANNRDGDILYFQPGQKEIGDAIEKLNKKLPRNIIALPYFRDLSIINKDLIENLHDKKKLIKIGKDQDLFTQDYSIGKESYEFIVIVSTNIAEASITISSLRYVVETGTQKVNNFDHLSNLEVLSTQFISESSRIQRRGRVGRVADGTVYYSYPKDFLANNKVYYSFAIQNIKEDILDLVKDYDDKIIYFNSENNPNDPKNLLDISNLTGLFTDNFHESIKFQYFNGNNYFDYFGSAIFDSTSFHNYYKLGFNKNTLDDLTGNFYLIHPDETIIDRNILGNIIKIHNNDLIISKMNAIWNNLVSENYIQFINSEIKKTEYGEIYNTFLQQVNLTFNPNYTKAFIYSCVINDSNLTENTIRLICLLDSGISSIASLLHDFKNLNLLKSKIGQFDSDLVALLTLINYFHSFLESNGININLDDDIYSFEFKNNLLNFDKIGSFSFDVYEKNKFLIERDLKYNYNRARITNEICNYIYKLINLKYKNQIELFCSKFLLKTTTVYKYIKNYLKFKNEIYKLKNDIEDIEDNNNFIKGQFDSEKFYNLLKLTKDLVPLRPVMNIYKNSGLNDEDIINIPFIISLPFNLLKKINNYFHLANYPLSSQKYSVAKSGFELDTLVNPKFISNYVLALNINSEKENIRLLLRVDPKLLTYLKKYYNSDIPFVTQKAMPASLEQVPTDKGLIRPTHQKIDVLKNKSTNYNYTYNLNEIHRDILTNPIMMGGSSLLMFFTSKI